MQNYDPFVGGSETLVYMPLFIKLGACICDITISCTVQFICCILPQPSICNLCDVCGILSQVQLSEKLMSNIICKKVRVIFP